MPDVELRRLAAQRRATFVHALSSYLDVTAVLLAGGAGTETALRAAARLGTGWPQQRLRSALDRCRLTGQTPWEAFAELGDHLDISELSQLATSLQLAGEHGARVRLTLTERARALRTQQLADIEARARAVTEHMSVPVALLAVAFMLFVGFPAVWVVLGEL
jgi:Flp pilus assembly protein TadB